MKKLMFIALGALALTACQQEKPKVDLTAAHQRDSLQQIVSQKNGEIDDMMSTLNDIQEGFREINEAENRVNLEKQGTEGTANEEHIRENIQFIQSAMKQNRQLINKLRQQLRESTFNSSQLKRTIANLMAQLDEKDLQLQQLRAELDAKDIHITELDENIANLNTNVSSLTDESTQKSQTISQQDKQLNTAWFVFGTKDELKEQHIFEGGKVLNGSFNKDYFTKIDIRIDKEIKLYSKSAKILTAHPSNSYSLQTDSKDQYVLRITNPQLFWSTSKYLVILVK
jgi:DNA repair exonuclease SbcCD ATPase subunit